jgi:ABC-type transporter Mla subunit MlaD
VIENQHTKSSENTMRVVDILVQTLEEVNSLTSSLKESAQQLDESALEEGLAKRKDLLKQAEMLKQEMLSVTVLPEEREQLWQQLAPVLSAVTKADDEFVALVEKKKNELGEMLASLYRQQKSEQYVGGGYNEHQ